MNKPLIIYDLEGTLGDIDRDLEKGETRLTLRPGLVEVLKAQKEVYNIVLATRLPLSYAIPFLYFLDQQGFQFDRAFTREDGIVQPDRSRTFPFKNLSAIYNWKKCDVRNMLVVEDTQLYPTELDRIHASGEFSEFVAEKKSWDITHRTYGNALPDANGDAPVTLLVGSLLFSRMEKRVVTMSRIDRIIRQRNDWHPQAMGATRNAALGHLSVQSFSVSNQELVQTPDPLLRDDDALRSFAVILPDSQHDVEGCELHTIKQG